MKKIITIILIFTNLIAQGQKEVLENLWKLYNSGDYERVIEESKPLIASDSLNIDLNLLLGRAYADKGNFESAIPYLDFVVNNDQKNSWRKAWALGYLGTSYFMLEDYDKSKKFAQACFALKTTKNVTSYAYKRILLFGFDDFYKNWETIESANFRFHFQEMSVADMGKFLSSREEAFKNINSFFCSSLPKKIDFFVWNSRKDAKELLKANLGFAVPEFCIVHSHYQQTKGHEMTHIIT